MNSKRLRRPSPAAIVLAVLALVLAIGGTAFAVSKVAPKNSVTGKSVKNSSLKGQDLKDNSVKGVDIDESTLDLPKGGDGFTGAAAGGDLTGKYPNPTLGANSVAGAEIAASSVGNSELQANAVNGAIVANGSLNGADVADGGLAGADVKDESLTGADLNPQRSVAVEFSGTNSDNLKTFSATCPAGKIATGGGATVTGNGADFVAITSTAPVGNGWSVSARELNPTAQTWQLAVGAVCLAL